MPVDERTRAQVQLILDRLREEGAAAYPPPARWDDEEVNDVDYLYQEYTILARAQDADRVAAAITAILDQTGYGGIPEGEGRQVPHEPIGPGMGIHRLAVPQTGTLVPAILGQLDQDLGPGVARPNHVLYLTPRPCPATEPEEVPAGTVDPFPPVGLNARCCDACHRIPWPGRDDDCPECDGHGVTVSIVDSGLIADTNTHSWLAAGVLGDQETDTFRNGNIDHYAGHGTFVAGCVRGAALQASVFVARGFSIDGAGAIFEADIPDSLERALAQNPDVLVLTFTAQSRLDLSLFGFDDFFERRLRYLKGLAVLAPAGNEGEPGLRWPAAYREVLSVGALSADWRARAGFSNFGPWVDVYAPGEDLINAFPTGTYVCNEPPFAGNVRNFQGMAKWSGTSFSTPIVAGMIAARMSATGETAQQAADSLMRLACGQAVPGIGAVLYPGQACCKTGHPHCRCH
jgi:hypothetical protein